MVSNVNFLEQFVNKSKFLSYCWCFLWISLWTSNYPHVLDVKINLFFSAFFFGHLSSFFFTDSFSLYSKQFFSSRGRYPELVYLDTWRMSLIPKLNTVVNQIALIFIIQLIPPVMLRLLILRFFWKT
jgi:hypothetical protein